MWGTVIGGVLGLIDKIIPDPKAAAEAKLKLLDMEQKGELSELSLRADVIKAEANSNNKLASSWRPILMLSFTAIVVNNYILAPYLDLIFKTGVILELPPEMWDLLKLGVSGYIVGRSGEKMFDKWKGNK